MGPGRECTGVGKHRRHGPPLLGRTIAFDVRNTRPVRVDELRRMMDDIA